MKKLLYIAYFFPPLGGAGVQRSLKFVRYLPEHGWQPTVLTSRAFYWMRDPSLLAEIPPNIEVVRVPHWGSRFGSGKSGGGGVRSWTHIHKLRSLARAFAVPDTYLGWTIPAERAARRLLADSSYRAILSTSSPDSAHLLGRRLKRATGLPWVADFRDPWTRRLSYAPPTRWHDRLHRSLERACLMEADRVIVTSNETREDFLERVPELSPTKIVVITNGYDEDDFTAAESSWKSSSLEGSNAAERSSSSDRRGSSGSRSSAERASAPILHAGQLNPERSCDSFLRGLRLYLERHPGSEDEVRTLFLGGHYDRHREAVRRFDLDGVVVFAESRPHLQSIVACLDARVLLLLEDDSDRGRLILPGKIFEYFRAQRPILCVSASDGAAAKLIRSLHAGWTADSEDPASVASGLEQLLQSDAPVAALDAIRGFERRALTARMARVLDDVSAP